MDVIYEDILEFWFSAPDKWFSKDTSFDNLIINKFSSVYYELQNIKESDLMKTSEQALAAIIVLDQFSRNMFRDTKKMYQSDGAALTIASKVIEKEMDLQLNSAQRKFMYMPYMHSEDINIQDKGLELFANLNDEITLDYAK